MTATGTDTIGDGICYSYGIFPGLKPFNTWSVEGDINIISKLPHKNLVETLIFNTRVQQTKL